MIRRKLLQFCLGSIGVCGSLPMFGDNVYEIYPIPHQQVSVNGNIQIVAGKVQIICGDKIDNYTKERLRNILLEHGIINSDSEIFVSQPTEGFTHIYVGVNGSNDEADAKATSLNLNKDIFSLANKYDKHLLSIQNTNGTPEIIILGENTDASFIGMASLEQILDKNQYSSIPCGVIYDYADQKNRGIVEGYYGVPYSIDVKKDIMRFMMKYKMNSYMYGAKSDYYHSTYWKQPYPTKITDAQKNIGYMSQDMVKDLTKVSHETKVNFVWAIHPGNSFLNSSTVISDIMSKYRSMYSLGVRQFAVFVDDVAIPSTQDQYDLNATRITNLQQAIEKEWNKTYTSPADTVKPLQFVPQIYCGSFAGGGEEQRKAFFTALSKTPSNVVIYTTGWGVWSVPNSSDVQSVRQYLGRDVAWWWNYPCNDNDADKLFTMDMYTNFHDESKISNSATVDKSLKNCLAVLSNPMQQGEVSKVALFGVADYAWNNSTFNSKNNWNASFSRIIKDKEIADAYMLLASYLRYYDSSSLSAMVNAYKNSFNKNGKADGSDLKTTMQSIINASNKMESLGNSEIESDRLLYKDIKPWLKKLHAMSEQVLGLINAAESDNDADKWNFYANTIEPLSDIDTKSDYLAPKLSGSVGATLSLTTQKTNPSQEVLRTFLQYLQDNSLGDLFGKPISTNPSLFTNLQNVKGVASKSNNTITFANNCINTLHKGEYIGIELPQPVALDDISLADTLMDSFSVLYSENGKSWNVYKKGMQLNSYVKYFVVENESDTPKTLKLARAIFKLTLPQKTSISSVSIPSGELYNNHKAAYMIDGDYTTYTCLNRNQKNNDAYVVKLQNKIPIGDVRICMGTVNGDYMTVGRVQISLDGSTWKDLCVKGTSRTDYRMNLPQVVKYSDEMSYCDFDGKNDSAQYVRLLLSTANTSKWFRLYDIEVNKATYAAKYKRQATDINGTAVDEVIDKMGYTGTSNVDSFEKNTLLYYFYDAKPVKDVIVFQHPINNESDGANVSVLTENGEWNHVDTLKGGYQKISLSKIENPLCLRIQWTDDNRPLIYEISETYESSEKPIVSSIERIGDLDDDLVIKVNDSSIEVESQEDIKSYSIFTMDGKKIMEGYLNNQKHIHIPMVYKGIMVVKVITESGRVSSYKFNLK